MLRRPSEAGTPDRAAGSSGVPVTQEAASSQGHQGSEAAARQAAQASTSGQTLKQEAQQDRAAVADKLIAVFADKAPAEWRKLIAFSKQWPSLADRSSCTLQAACTQCMRDRPGRLSEEMHADP